MKLSRFSSPTLSLSLIAGFASRMVVGCSRCAWSHVSGVVVLLAELTLAPVGMAAGVQRTLSPFEQKVVRPIRADNQVLRAIIGSDVVPVVDFFGASQVAPQGTFSHKDVLIHVTAPIHPRVVAYTFLDIATNVRYPAIPISILVSVPQSRAPIVCAGNALNLTHSGGFRG